MLDVGGQDATEAFEDVGHSDEAREILDGMLVGKLRRVVSMVRFPLARFAADIRLHLGWRPRGQVFYDFSNVEQLKFWRSGLRHVYHHSCGCSSCTRSLSIYGKQ